MARNLNNTMASQTASSNRGSLNPVEAQRKIRDIAQKLYEKRGRIPGHELEDWLEAERIVGRIS